MECFSRGNCSRILSLWTLLIATFNIAGLHGPVPSSTEVVDAVKVAAVAGGEAILPCDTRSPQPPDALLLVVWYKNDVPIYSYDGRVKGPTAHWADDLLTGRARWHSASPSSLRIRDVVPGDLAMYRCRVDFKISPTRNHKIMLDVIELPEKPKIFDERDKEIIGIAGPYYEDSSIKLSCVVSGGKPMPRLRWWRDDKVIATLAPLEDGSRLSILELKIPKVTREYLGASYTCTADNTPLVAPLRVNVQIQLYLRPLLVEILAREQPLSVGQEAEITCRAIGARPPAVITWWLDGKQLQTVGAQKNSADNNETSSVLRWVPRMEHDRRTLTCRASHVKLEHSTIETTLSLNLHYVPIVSLQLGSKLNPNDIEEGDDVYFDCVVRANPPAYKVVWEHNGQIMMHNQRAGVIAGSTHLALQKVSKEHSGKYICTASNVEGDGRSPPVNLQVIYKPVCVNEAPLLVGAAMNEAVKVTCEVDAFPQPKNFQWTLNNSMGTLELEAAKFTAHTPGKSVLTYTPSTEGDYGTLSCRASNLAGQQIEPCRYTLLPAVRPDPPYNCTAVNLTDDSVELRCAAATIVRPSAVRDYSTLSCRVSNLAGQQIEPCRYTLLRAVRPDPPYNCTAVNLTDASLELRCAAGYDGGLKTTYIVEAWSSGVLIANSSSATPVWRLRALGAGKALKMIFYAHNARGKSESVLLRIHTLSRLALHTEAKNSETWDVSWTVGITAGMASSFILIGCLAVLLKKRHHRPMEYRVPLQNAKGYKGTLQTNNHSPLQADDKNPDVIPLGKDFHCSKETDRPPEPPPYGSVVSPPVGSSRSTNSLHDRANTPHTPNTPASDAQSIGTMAEDRRSVTSGTLSRRREVVTTRTPLLAANARESCV